MRLIAFFLFLLEALPACASSVNVIFYDNRFGTVNDVNGAYSQVSTLPVSKAGGLAGLNGMLDLEDFGNNLYAVDSVTGSASLVGNTGANLSLAAFGGDSNGLFELDYSSNLYSISAQTGRAKLVGATGLAANNGQADTSLSASGNLLYYTAGRSGARDELYTIDMTTGRATDLGSTGVTGIAGSAIVNGNLELYQYGQDDNNYIYSAALGTTNFTRVSRLGAQIIDGGVAAGSFGAAGLSVSTAQSAVPEAGSVWLLLSGLGVTAGMRRGRRWFGDCSGASQTSNPR